MTLGLTDKIVRLHRAMATAELPHAFGGALALAFCVEEPRATRDIDLNVFIGVDRVEELIAALPRGVRVTGENRARLQRHPRSARARLGTSRRRCERLGPAAGPKRAQRSDVGPRRAQR